MQIEVARAELRRVRTVAPVARPLAEGEARLGIESFGLTSNNVTYAVMGEQMAYGRFFPAGGDDAKAWGRVPVWGFARVVESGVTGLAVGTRVFGYLPMGDEVVVAPGRLDPGGFTDQVAHRRDLPGVYNRYSVVGSDPLLRHDREAEHMLLWPLFVTSFVIDDFLGDHDLFGAATVVVSSASAKTAVGAAMLLAERPDLRVVGLTSAANLEFVASLSCYDEALTYDRIDELGGGAAVYVDVAGRRDVTGAVHARYGDGLAYSMIVGDTHWEHRDAGPPTLPGPRPTLLFAPDQITKRRREWGRQGFEAAVGAAWDRFIPWTGGWLDVRHLEGAPAVEATYRRLLDGDIDPRVGHVCTLSAVGG